MGSSECRSGKRKQKVVHDVWRLEEGTRVKLPTSGDEQMELGVATLWMEDGRGPAAWVEITPVNVMAIVQVNDRGLLDEWWNAFRAQRSNHYPRPLTTPPPPPPNLELEIEARTLDALRALSSPSLVDPSP